MDVTLNVTQSGTSLTGTTSSQVGSADIRQGTINGNRFNFSVSVNTASGEMAVVFSGTVQGNSMSGSVEIAGMGSMDFTGLKNPREV